MLAVATFCCILGAIVLGYMHLQRTAKPPRLHRGAPTMVFSEAKREAAHTNRTAAPRSPSWVYHEGHNCFPGAGGHPVVGRDLIGLKLPTERCQEACIEEPTCEGVVVQHGKNPGPCWLRTRVEPSACMQHTPWDLFYHGLSTGAATEVDANEVELPAPSANETTLPAEPRSPTPGARSAASFNSSDWVRHEGYNCFAGYGGQALPGKDLVSFSMHTSVCQKYCNAEPQCEGVLVLHNKSPGPCWFRTSLEVSACVQRSPWDLFIRRAPRRIVPPGSNLPRGNASETSHNRSAAPTKNVTEKPGGSILVWAGSTTAKLANTTVKPTTAKPTTAKPTTAKPTTAKPTTPNTTTAKPTTPNTTTAEPTTEEPTTEEPTADEPTTAKPATEEPTTEEPTTEEPTTEEPTTEAPTTEKPCEKPCKVAAPPDQCPSCTPKSHGPLSVVVPTFERDFCKFTYLVKSILKHDPHQQLGDVYILWVSTQSASGYASQVDEVRRMFEGTPNKMHLLDFSAPVNSAGKAGWFAQQILKLKIAAIITSDYYMVLDSKNTLMRDIEPDTFFTSCNQAKIFGEYRFDQLPGLHAKWYRKSAEFLHVSAPSSGYWPASITPMTFHRQTVLDMLGSIGEDSNPYNLCAGQLCSMLDGGGTEFTMYLDYANHQQNFHCVHEALHMDWVRPICIALWRGLDGNVPTCKDVATGRRFPAMFGAQVGALDTLADWQRSEASKYLTKIFADADLFDAAADSADTLLNCIVGRDDAA